MTKTVSILPEGKFDDGRVVVAAPPRSRLMTLGSRTTRAAVPSVANRATLELQLILAQA